MNNSLTIHGFDGEIFQFLRILCISVLTPFLINSQQTLELYNTIISIIGERYGVKNEIEILRQYDIATATFADTSNEIVEMNACIQKAPKNIIIIYLFSTFFWSLLGVFTLSNGGDSDISCLKSTKESLEDPFNRFKSF
ncbi:hypothetical protein CFP56_014517 [Quercus suber]|uniref:Uncharacterized protein n=1 Tax=Quercus suber TaxID=58331 RepID=A0AAW0M579_QUESU